jgi:hypothetical protein
MRYAKRNLPVIVILLALLLIIFVIWFYNKRIEGMDKKITPAASKTNALSIPAIKIITINHHLSFLKID